MKFTDIPDEIPLTEDLFLEKQFSTDSSLVCNLMGTENFLHSYGISNIMGSTHSKKEVFSMIGWIDIHFSDDPSCKVFVRARLPECFSLESNERKSEELLHMIFKRIGISRECTYTYNVETEKGAAFLTNGDDGLY